jgi:hypothetical protein
MRKLARLAADMLDLSVAVITAPASWATKGLRRYADHDRE